MNLTKKIADNITLNALLKIMALLALLVMLSPRVAHAQVFNVPCDPAALIEAIEAANNTPGHDTVLLAAGCTYSLSVAAEFSNGPAGLPLITDALTIEGNGARLERSADASEQFRLMVASSEAPLSITDLTLANGHASSSDSIGGAIRTWSSLSLTNVNVVDNQAGSQGGGIAVHGNSNMVLLDNSRFENNQGSRGGGLYAEGSVLATNVSFVNNYGSYAGGGMYALGDTVSIQSSQFEGNSVSIDNIALGSGFGGGLYADGDLNIGQTQFINNSAKAGGGLSLGGGISVGGTFRGHASIAGVRFEGNAAVNGGAIALYDGSITLAQSIFRGNTADINGAAVVFLKLRPNRENEVVNNLWVDNHVSGVSYTVYARGTADTTSDLEITHNTLVDSSHNDDAAFFIDQVGVTGIWNNIIAYYETGLVSTSELVYAGYNIYYIEGDSWVGPVEDDGHNLFTDPLFVNTATEDYRLRNDSPAIDSGFGPVAAQNDLNGVNRPQGDGYDIGAYEFVPSTDSITAIDDDYSTLQDTPLTISAPGVLSNDVAFTGSLTARLESGPSNGTLTFNADGSFVYTPNNSFHGQDSFTYRATDGLSDSNIATVFITVESVNSAPVAYDDTYTTPADTPLTVAAPGVLSNDVAFVSNLTAVLESNPSNGTLTLNADGSFTYSPNNGFSGQDSFAYRATDGQSDSNIATVTITVENGNQAPTANDDTYTTPADTPLTVAAPGVLSNDSDADGDGLGPVLESGPSNGTLILHDDGGFTYTPNSGFTGQDSFTYRASDGQASSNVATVTITIENVNNAPVANDDAYTTPAGTPLTVAAPGVLGNDSDADGDGLGPMLESGPSNGTLALHDDGGFTYKPNDGFTGQDSFTYQAIDGQASSNVATVAITVESVNNAPVANDNAYTTSRNTPLVVAAPGVLGNDSDADGDSLTAVLENGPSNGTLTLNADGSFTYTPNHGFGGQDSFTYRATDGQDSSNVATVIINTTNRNKDKRESNPTPPAQEISPENSEGSNTATDPVPVDQ